MPDQSTKYASDYGGVCTKTVLTPSQFAISLGYDVCMYKAQNPLYFVTPSLLVY